MEFRALGMNCLQKMINTAGNITSHKLLDVLNVVGGTGFSAALGAPGGFALFPPPGSSMAASITEMIGGGPSSSDHGGISTLAALSSAGNIARHQLALDTAGTTSSQLRMKLSPKFEC